MSVKQDLRKQITDIIQNQYGALPEYLWSKYPTHCIFRHTSNKKWFAIIMQVEGNKLGLKNNQLQNIINVKCDAYLISTLHRNKGFLPAYHMNKNTWMSILLDGTVKLEDIIKLVDLSYEMTQ